MGIARTPSRISRRHPLQEQALLDGSSELMEDQMSMDRDQQDRSATAAPEPLSAEERNRQAAAERACRREGIEWIEDRRSRPRSPGSNREGPR
jgi:hypothetical protein